MIFAGILGASALGAWVADHPGDVTIQFETVTVDTSFAAVTLAVAALVFFTGLSVWLVGWLRREFPIFGSNREIKRQSRGLTLVNKALVALSAGDHKLAKRLIGQAEVLLPPQPMVHLIAAETASRSGDMEAANARYKALETSDNGRLIGLRGLVTEARRLGHNNEALSLARAAFEENRKSPWVLKTLFSLEVAAGHWGEAETALKKVVKEGLLDSETHVSHTATLLYGQAVEAGLAGDQKQAEKLYKASLAKRPGFAPAVAALAKLDMQGGHPRRAEKRILDAWRDMPHPALAVVYKELDTGEARSDWVKRVRALIAPLTDDPEALILLSDALMAADRPEDAKPLLEKLTVLRPTKRVWRLRLKLAQVLGEETTAIEAALLQAPEGFAWRCQDCGEVAVNWSALCPSCGMFDQITWQSGIDIKPQRSAKQTEATILLLED